jgi:hypothetical protein
VKRKLLASFVFFASFLVICVSLFAHHGGSEYDQKNLLTMKGTVTEFNWSNPHCQIFLDVTDDKGGVAHWGIETNSISVMTRAGWNRKVIKAGDQVTITVAPSKKGTPIGLIRKLVLADGREFSAGSLGERPSEQ